MNLTPLQKQKLISIYPELRQYFDMEDLKEKKSENTQLLIALVNKIQSLKGEKGDSGYSPVKGKDYFTPQEAQMFLDYVINTVYPSVLEKSTPIKGVHYKDGDNYILTNKDKKEIASQINVPVVDKIIERTEVIKEVSRKLTVEDVKGAVSKKELEIEKKEILSGMQRVDGRIKLIDQRWHGGGLSQVYHDSTLTGTGTSSNPLSVIGGGGSGFQLPLTGSLNQTVFTWKTAPNAICCDGIVYQAVQQDGTVNWTLSGVTTTLSFSPSSSIFAVA